MRVLFITNYPSPYRVDFWNLLGKQVDLTVVFTSIPQEQQHRSEKWFNNDYSGFKALFLKRKVKICGQYICADIFGVLKERNSTELTIFLTCAVGIGIASIANEFVPWFFGPGFEPCIQLVYWFVPVLFAKAIGDLIRTQYMIPAKMDRLYTVAVVVGAGVNLVANYIFISSYGALGAVLGTLLAESAVTICELIYTRRDIRFEQYILENGMYLLSSIGMFVFVRKLAYMLPFSTAVQLVCMIGAGGFTYIIISLVIWKYKRNSIFKDLLIRKGQT